MSLLSKFFPVPRLWSTLRPGATGKGDTEQQLGLAMEQRSIMTVTFPDPEMADMAFSGPCLHAADGVLHIDAPFQGKHFSCFDKAVDVSFVLNNGTASSYFRFISTVFGYARGSGFVLEAPKELVSNQRRNFVRITPPDANILCLEIWPLESEDLPPVRSFAPLIGGGWSKKENRVALLNISTSGLRLKVTGHPDGSMMRFEEGSRLVCFLWLKNVESRSELSAAAAKTPASPKPPACEKASAFWLACTVKHCMEEKEGPGVLLGVNFTDWAVPDEGKNPPSWSRAGEAGRVDPLGDWVWRQQLALASRNRL